jgi:hypothetical protein
MQGLPAGLPRNISRKRAAAAIAKPLFCFAIRRHQKKIRNSRAPARDARRFYPANRGVFQTGSDMNENLKRAALAILAGGMAAGAIDIVSAGAGRAAKDWGQVLSMLQFMATGLLGKAALTWNLGLMAATGLAAHFGLTLIMAALFVLAARRWDFLLRHTWAAGICYGVLIYLAMSRFIVPHSGVPVWKTPPGFWANVNPAMGHAFFVGLPIAAAARHFLRREA